MKDNSSLKEETKKQACSMQPVVRVARIGNRLSKCLGITAVYEGVTTLPLIGRFFQGLDICDDPNAPLIQTLDRMKNKVKGFQYRVLRRVPPNGRPKVVVLGTGWGSLYFLNQIDPTKYDVTVVSPRPFFVYTPLLPAAMSGSLSMRSVVEPIRNKLFFGGAKAMQYLEAEADDVDVKAKTVKCKKADGQTFEMPFDNLVMAVGSETNTFGIPGVKEHASFLKEVEDAREIRLKVLENFEKAATPGTSEAEKKKLLSFVVVGGGPAGVEAAAEMQDMINKSLKPHFPELVPHSKVTVVEMLPGVLQVYGKEISDYTGKQFKELGIQTLLGHRVCKVDADNVHVVDKKNQTIEVPYGSLVWASGVGQVGLSKELLNKIEAQKGNRMLRVSPSLQVLGASSMYAMGDCALVTPNKLEPKTDILFNRALRSPWGPSRLWLWKSSKPLLREGFVQLHPTQCNAADLSDPKTLDPKEFKEALKKLDSSYKPPIPTAQMARQAGAYLGVCFNKRNHNVPFAPTSYGHMSYIGGGKAVLELTTQRNTPRPKSLRILGNRGSGMMWNGYYWLQQTSKYNRLLSMMDFMKSSIKGRDIIEPTTRSTATKQEAEPEKK